MPLTDAEILEVMGAKLKIQDMSDDCLEPGDSHRVSYYGGSCSKVYHWC